MKRQLAEQNAGYLRFQRNIFAALSLLVAMGLVIVSSFLFLKKERIVVVPPMVEKEFWVEGHAVSATYLEQFGYFLGQLLLGKSAHSAAAQRNLLLRHTDPGFAGTLRKKLLEEEEMLQKQNASYTFYPVSVAINQAKKEVLIEGDRVLFVGGKQLSQEREGYVLSFNFSGSRLMLAGVSSANKGEQACAN